ncbi:MAG: TonB family protein [Archangium sp.]|nr:TonB family protein [Archangium sp.]
MFLAEPRRRPTRRALLVALPLSLLGHGLLLLLFLGYSALTASPPKPKRPVNRPVTLKRIDSRHWASNRGGSAPTVEKPAPLHPEGQVVDVAPGNHQLSPDAKYLATTDNRVTKETRAKEQTNRYSRATPATQARPEQQPSAKGRPAPVAPPPSGIDLTASMLGRQVPREALMPQKVSGTDTEVEASPAVAGTESGLQGTQGGDKSEGGGAPNDDLDKVQEGDGTFLNTREWKYAAFFNRVKQAVSARWDPNARLRARNRGLGMAARLTVLHVTLRPDGSIADLFVAQSCGLDELDVEAMNAFTKAQPFANPPPALVENGLISFGFSFRVSDEGLAMPLPFRFR